MHADPIQRFIQALEAARVTEPFDATAAALATVDIHGSPSVRFVLVKVVDARGFVFFTNGNSRKARELTGHPQAALAFHWHTRGEQVRVEGSVTRIAEEESDRYFATRPRASQLGAWASDQSDAIATREELEARLTATEQRFANADVPRPPHWGGYRITPTRIEFWRDRSGRLHDRELFTRAHNIWSVTRLQP